MGFNQNEEPIASFNKLRDEVLCLKTQVSELRVDELWSLAKKFPLLNVKVFQYIHSMQLFTARMREEVSELRNEMIEMKSENIVHETRNTSGSTKTLEVSSKRIGIKESKPQHKLFNEAGSSGEVKENAASGSEIKESSSVKPVERESLNEDVIKRQNELIERYSKKIVPLEQFSRHLLERIKSLECGRNGSVVWKLSGFNHIFEAAKRAEVKSKNEKVPTDFFSPIILTGSPGYSLYVRLFPFGCEVAAGNHVSVFVALIPGMYDAILKWPFKSTIKISVISQHDPADRWTRSIVPSEKTGSCFKRPSSCKGNMSVGILYFLPHR